MDSSEARKKILLLAGWSGAGKDTLAARLMNCTPFKRYAFADPVKDAAAEWYGFPRALADTEEGKRSMWKERTVREWIIFHGEEEKRVHGKDVWAKRIAAQILDDVETMYFVITDWRFIDELVALQKSVGAVADIYPMRVVNENQRISPVASLTEYSLLGFPMPEVDIHTRLDYIYDYMGM